MNPITAHNLGFLRGIAWMLAQQRRSSAIADVLERPGVTIACRNATVLIGRDNEVSWINNNAPPLILPSHE